MEKLINDQARYWQTYDYKEKEFYFISSMCVLLMRQFPQQKENDMLINL